MVATGGDTGASALAKGLLVLQAFDSDTPQSLSSLVGRVALPKSTVHRILGELVRYDFVRRREDGRYEVSISQFELSRLPRRQMSLLTASSPLLQDLATTTGRSVFLSQLNEDQLVCLESVPAPHLPPLLWLTPRTRRALHCTALGKVFLADSSEQYLDEYLTRDLVTVGPNSCIDPSRIRAELDATRERRFAVTNEEVWSGVFSVAAAVRDGHGLPIAAVTLVGTDPTVVRHHDVLLEHCARIGATLRSDARRPSKSRSSQPSQQRKAVPSRGIGC
jgi:DNA-binding IclR family transcriptional regulator